VVPVGARGAPAGDGGAHRDRPPLPGDHDQHGVLVRSRRLDDQEFVVSFECDDPGEFLDLVQELRTSESSAFTLRDTPIFTCVAMSTARALDALDGTAAGATLRAV
jgi:hypothetical protein